MTIRITGFPSMGNDTERWNRALEQAVKNGNNEIFFPAGTYHFFPEESRTGSCAYSAKKRFFFRFFTCIFLFSDYCIRCYVT